MLSLEVGMSPKLEDRHKINWFNTIYYNIHTIHIFKVYWSLNSSKGNLFMSSPKLIQMLPFRVHIIEVKIRWSLRIILIIKNSLCLRNRKLVLYLLYIFIFLVGNTFQTFNELMMYSIKYFRIYISIFQDCELTSLLNIDLIKLIDS